MATFNPYAQYADVTFGSQDPGKLVVTAYDGVIRGLKGAIRAIDENDYESRAKSFDLALGLVGELRKALDHTQGGEFATKLESLYAFFSRELLMANATSDSARLKPVLEQVKVLRDAWEEARKNGIEA
ncbi:flagellar export chaperone FliS [bacterium]|nr:flagellar export chaperone FliS [bacterium]